MKREMLKLLVAASFAAFAAMPALAQNSRPVSIGSSGEQSLQDILTGTSGFETVNAANDQSTTALWSLDSLPIDHPSGIDVVMNAEWAGNASTNQLGIWTGNNMLPILYGPATLNTIAHVIWFPNGDIEVTGSLLNPANSVNVGLFSGTGISPSQFGFFLLGTDGNIYSADSKNGPSALMLAYASPSTPHDWMFGSEDTRFGDKDYQDMVFRASDLVTAIPEPETYAMLLAGLGLMVFIARRRRQYAAV